MGLGPRRPVLPARTESSLQDSAEEIEPASPVPEDGTPLTLKTLAKILPTGKLTKRDQTSQTSLLIEYYEGSKDPNSNRRPSVRVRVTPSGSAKSNNTQGGNVSVPEVNSSRKPSYTRKISLGSDRVGQTINPGSVSSLGSLEGHRVSKAPPLNVETMGVDGNELSRLGDSPEAKYIVAPSDISSIPPDSMLDAPLTGNPRESPAKQIAEKAGLEALPARANPNASNERFSQKVIEKLANKPRIASSGRRRQRALGQEEGEIIEDQPRRWGKSKDEERISEPTNSLLSAAQKSTDQVSYRSGASQTSLTNNPRLLRTVEDAIRRLIMPELEEIKKKQKISKSSKYDREPSDYSESSVSREDYVRRHSSGSRRRRRRTKELDLDSPSDRSYHRHDSIDSLSTDEHRSHSHRGKDHHRVRDAAAAGMAGAALTATALRHHGSQNSIEREERRRRRRRSRSRSSRSVSVADSEEIFHKHDVPPMPMRSEVDSEVTRSSLLSSKTGSTTTPLQREVREVVRGSPLGAHSPASRTPTRTPVDLRKGLGTHHGNLSEHDLNVSKEDSGEVLPSEGSPYNNDAYAGLSAAAGGLGALAAHQLLTDPERVRKYESNLHQQHPIRRGLSPIQSVASYTTTEPNRNSIMQPRSSESLNSLKKDRPSTSKLSIESFSSAPSTDVARSKRPKGISLENRREIMAPHEQQFQSQQRAFDDDQFFDDKHSQDEQYRDSFESSDPKIDVRHLPNHTDNSLDVPYLDKLTAGQQLARGRGANPEYVYTPPGVESAVASLYEPSMLSGHDERSPVQSYSDSLSRRDADSPRSFKPGERSIGGSPLKEQHLVYSEEDLPMKQRFNDPSPPQSVARSVEEQDVTPDIISAGVPDHSNEGQATTSPESEITTNPSVIQGPIGGLAQANRDHWPYNPTPPQEPEVLLSPPAQDRDIGISGADFIPDVIGVGLPPTAENNHDIYSGNQILSTPPGAKADEGYVTADNPKSPLYSPQPKVAVVGPAKIDFDDLATGTDPFTTKRDRYMSGLSQGMASPLYDSATGRGIDRIQSKDIMALMDHLTVRDAQRNARDTEILVTLVRSAAEMRNSFEDMQKFIAEQNGLLIDAADKQHEKTQKVIGGPRPPPSTTAQFTRSIQSEEDETATRKKNVFRRALQGLGSKNKVELQNIEQMLLHLLGEVETLRAVQEGRTVPTTAPTNGLSSAENVRAATDPGYEPEGQAGTSSTGDRSGFFSNNSSRQADYRGFRRESGNRVSTVIEDNESEPEREAANEDVQFRNANHDTFNSVEASRGTFVPVSTPPRMNQQVGVFSADNTPQLSTEGTSGRKHKSAASYFLPRISRWSKTTASSVTDNFRSSNQTTDRQRPYSEMSRSGSDLGDYPYDPQGEDRLRSATSLANEQENRPPSPLIPSQVSEKPKYQAHRNSQNLHHPQPRQGPTGRYQYHLESEAINYEPDPFSPTSQTSSQWDNQPGHAMDPNAQQPQHVYRAQPPLSPISDNLTENSSPTMRQDRPGSIGSGASADQYRTQQPPPRPPKIKDEDPLVPQRPPKVAMTPPPSNRQTTYVDHVAAARAGSPAFDKSPVAALRNSPGGQPRKPSGPRPITSSGQYGKGPRGDLNAIKRTRFRGSPNHIDSDDEIVAAY